MRLCSLLFALAIGVGCNGDTPTSPTDTTTTTTTTVASPIYSEEWIDTLAVGGERFYSFTVTQYGTVNISLTSVSGQYVPGTVTLGMGLGTPDAETCLTTSSISTQSGAGPQLTGAYNPKTNGSPQSGSFTAPWDGIHGWYLKHDSTSGVVPKLELAGFHELESK